MALSEEQILIIYGCITLVESIITVIGNSLTIHAFRKEPSLSVRPSKLLVLALSVSDLTYGAYLFLYYGVTFSWYPYGEIGCMISVFFEYSIYVSYILLIVISVDRVLFVGLDYTTYMKYQSKKRFQLIVLLCVGIGVVMSIIELSLWNYAKRVNERAAKINFDLYCLYPARRMDNYGLFTSVVYYIVPLILLSILSLMFMILLRRRLNMKNKIGCSSGASGGNTMSTGVSKSAASTQDKSTTNGQASESVALQSTVSTVAEQSSAVTASNQQPKDAKNDELEGRSRYIKPAMTLAALVGSMMLTFFPYCIYNIVSMIHPEIDNSASLIYILMLVSQMNPALDPLLYAATQKSIQTYYKRKLTKIFGSCCRE